MSDDCNDCDRISVWRYDSDGKTKWTWWCPHDITIRVDHATASDALREVLELHESEASA